MQTVPEQLFPYVGRKATLASKITKLMATHHWTRYVEPFAGGASVFWQLKKEGRNARKCFVLNDVNNLIITAYRVGIEQPAELKLKLKASLYSQELHRLSSKIINSPSDYTDLEIAWGVIYNTRSSFFSKINDSWNRCGGGEPGTKNSAKQYSAFLEYLPDILNLLQGTFVSNEDALTCLKKWDSLDTLFYCDPPYPGTSQHHYSGYTQGDFDRLIECCASLRGTVVLSCYPNDSVPPDWIKHEFKRNSSMARKSGITSARIETVWVKPSNISTPLLSGISDRQLSLF